MRARGAVCDDLGRRSRDGRSSVTRTVHLPWDPTMEAHLNDRRDH